MSALEQTACVPRPVDPAAFNPDAKLPYGLSVAHVRTAMQEFIEFLGFVNSQLLTRNQPRLESMLMPANFSSIVGESLITALPKHCPTLVRANTGL